MKISVIVPCYNVENRVRDALDFLVAQSIGLEHLELILVDDASTDGTVEILREYECRYPEQVMLVLCEENGRQGKARNIGMAYASGEWISFVDADDQVHPMMYEILCSIGEKTDADLVTFIYSSDSGFMNNRYSINDLPYRLFEFKSADERRRFVIDSNLINNSCTQKLYKRELLIETEVQYAEGVCYEEPLFTYPLRYAAKRIAVMDIPLYYYHLNPNGTINSTMSDPSTIQDHLSVQLQLLEYMREQPYYEYYKDEIELNFLHCFIYEPYIFLKKRGFDMPESLSCKIRRIAGELIPDYKNNPYLDRIPSEEYAYIVDTAIRIDIWLGIGAQGGVESLINKTALYLKRQGIKIRVIQLVGTVVQWIENEIPFISLVDGPLTSWDGVYEKYLEFYKENTQPDLILVEAWPILNAFARRLVKENNMSSRIVARVHDSIESYDLSGVGGMDFLGYADVHLALNSDIQHQIQEAYPKARVYRVNSSINEDILCYNETRDIHELAYVGRFSVEKNISEILSVVSELPVDWRLTLIGDGPELSNVKESIERFGMNDRVIMYSWMDKPWEIIKKAGVLLVTSNREIGPLVAIEAMACGMMVISKPVGIMPDVIVDGKNGYLCKDSEEIKGILLDMEAGRIAIPTSQGCKASVESFIGDKNLEEMVSILKDVINGTEQS